jgi:hypothetical protein
MKWTGTTLELPLFNPFCDFFAVDRDYKFVICTDRETVSSSAGHEIACTIMQPKATAAAGSRLAVKRTNTFAITFL